MSLTVTSSLQIAFAVGWLTLLAAMLRMGKWWLLATGLAIGSAWLLYAPSLLVWIEHLGSDSFSEAQNFDVAEALNFLQSLNQVLRRESIATTALTVGIGAVIAVAGTRGLVLVSGGGFNPSSMPAIAVAGALAVGSMSMQLSPAFAAFRSNSELYQAAYDNFHAHPGARVIPKGPARDLNVVVYLGESTSALNMGIYGYPRQTTPKLAAFQAENDGFLLFHNVFATHVHTAPSLLEALSIGTHPAQDWLPIAERRRVSIVDLLNQAGIPSTLISNQGSAGTWNNLASTVVFRNVSDKEFSFNAAWLGELEHKASRPLDTIFLPAALDRRQSLRTPGPKLILLHSYAGHGPYLRNIDPRFTPVVDQFIDGIADIAVVGSSIAEPANVVRTIQEYDSAIRYIDHSIVTVMQRVRAASHPSVFVYFSDHGDAVYAGRRHDSSRFLHEMARVPFLVYFNDAAARAYPDLLNQFRDAADQRRVSTLAQFPASLLSLFGLEVEGGQYNGVGLDELDALAPILTRETGAGHSYVRLGDREHPGHSVDAPRDATDPYTTLFLANKEMLGSRPALCLQASNTIGKALRGALVADCLWLDLAVQKDGSPVVDPSPAVPPGLGLETMTDIARGYDLSLWIAARDADAVASCHAISTFFSRDALRRPPKALVMFPSTTQWQGSEMRACADSLRSNGINTAFEVPAGLAQQCTAALMGGAPGVGPCEELASILGNVAASGVFTDLGFDISVVRSVEKYAAGYGLQFNAWNVSASDIAELPGTVFRMIGLEPAQDPNDR